MKLALLTEANPRMINQSHPSFVQSGKYRVTAGSAKSKLSVRRTSMDRSVSTDHAIDEVIDGNCILVINIIEVHPEDARINVYAERLNV
jgi:hypothetical protein